MARFWNGTLATQTVTFRGTSTIQVLGGGGLPNFRDITDAKYSVVVSGGVSGSFGVHVLGFVGNTTHMLAGLTAITAAGARVLYPIGYSTTGVQNVPGTVVLSLADMNHLDMSIPPSHVVFQSGVATAGISATITVGAHIRENG